MRKVASQRLEIGVDFKAAPTHDFRRQLPSRLNAMQTQAMMTEVENQIKRYEELRTKGIAAIKIQSPEDMMLLPIEYRIAKRLTQEEFAIFVEIPLRQICRYELSEYSEINGENFKKFFTNSLPLSGYRDKFQRLVDTEKVFDCHTVDPFDSF